MSKKNGFNFSYLASLLASLTILIIIGVSGSMNKYSLRFFLSVFSKKEIGNLQIPVVDIKTGKITRGIVSRDETKNLAIETIQKNFTAAKTTHIFLTANACGNLDVESKQEKIAHVVVRIFVNGVPQASACMQVNNGVLTLLAASAGETVELEPGSTEIKVESVFYGPVRDIKTSLNYTMVTKSMKKLREFNDL